MTSSKIIEVMAGAIERLNPTWKDAIEEAEAVYAALQASGMAVVPVEPNNTVVTAGCFALDGPAAREALMAAMLSGDRHAVGQTKMRLRWAAMLAAANDGKAVVQEASAEAQSAVAHSPNIKAPDREGEQDE